MPLFTASGMNQLQSKSMSGAARLEHQRMACESKGASRSSTLTCKARYRPRKIGIWINSSKQPPSGL